MPEVLKALRGLEFLRLCRSHWLKGAQVGLRFLGDPSAATSLLAGCLSGGSGKVRRLGPSGRFGGGYIVSDALLGYFHLGFSTLFGSFGTGRGLYRSFGSRVPRCGCPTLTGSRVPRCGCPMQTAGTLRSR